MARAVAEHEPAQPGADDADGEGGEPSHEDRGNILGSDGARLNHLETKNHQQDTQ